MNRALVACASRCDVVRCLGRVALPELGDWCDLDLIQDGMLQRVAALRAPHCEVYGPPGGPSSLLAWSVVRTGRPELLRGPSEQVLLSLSPGDGDLLRFQEATDDPIHEAMVSGQPQLLAVVEDPALWRGGSRPTRGRSCAGSSASTP